MGFFHYHSINYDHIDWIYILKIGNIRLVKLNSKFISHNYVYLLWDEIWRSAGLSDWSNVVYFIYERTFYEFLSLENKFRLRTTCVAMVIYTVPPYLPIKSPHPLPASLYNWIKDLVRHNGILLLIFFEGSLPLLSIFFHPVYASPVMGSSPLLK